MVNIYRKYCACELCDVYMCVLYVSGYSTKAHIMLGFFSQHYLVDGGIKNYNEMEMGVYFWMSIQNVSVLLWII